MKWAYTTTFDASDMTNWSGTPFHMSRALEQSEIELDYIGSLSRKVDADFKIKQAWKKWICGQRESPRFNVTAAKNYSAQVTKKLAELHHVQAVISPLINPICYVECKQPIILWTDALYSSLVGFYPEHSKHSASSIAAGNEITRACLSRATLAVFCSDWAARSAVELYGADPKKIKVIPFGANITCSHQLSDIREMLAKRSSQKIQLLFLGKHWNRKGGDIVFRVAKALYESGQPVELHFVGCHPPKTESIPPYIHCHGFISKRSPEGAEKINQLLRESHFLFVPSRAEAYGIVFCEANAFGLPCLTSPVGGIGTIIQDNVNGMKFALDTPASDYCDYIVNLMHNRKKYDALALSSFNEYETRLNWNVASRAMKALVQNILAP